MRRTGFIIVATTLLLSCCTKHPDLGDGYQLDSDGRYTLQVINHENTVMIKSHILDCVFDSSYIIVMQRPWDSIPNVKSMKYKESFNAFEESEFSQYWIIFKKEKNQYYLDTIQNIAKYSNLYGPFKKDMYLQKRKELNIPPELKLKE